MLQTGNENNQTYQLKVSSLSSTKFLLLIYKVGKSVAAKWDHFEIRFRSQRIKFVVSAIKVCNTELKSVERSLLCRSIPALSVIDRSKHKSFLHAPFQDYPYIVVPTKIHQNKNSWKHQKLANMLCTSTIYVVIQFLYLGLEIFQTSLTCSFLWFRLWFFTS